MENISLTISIFLRFIMTAISHPTQFSAKKKTKRKRSWNNVQHHWINKRGEGETVWKNRENLWKCDYDEDVWIGINGSLLKISFYVLRFFWIHEYLDD